MAEAGSHDRELLKRSIEKGTKIATEIRGKYDNLKRSLDAEDEKTEGGVQAIDDEYGEVGLADPRVCVTTSREPSSRLKQFSKELALIIPNASKINRGGYRIDELVQSAKESDFTDVVMVQETRGEPDGLVISHLPHGPTAFFSLTGTVLRHDIEGVGSMSEVYPHLILEGFTTTLGKRVGNILKALLPVPKHDSKR
jgi:U3 small nucleolar ribonucleoprotein protein IMP4